ncbi:MAG: phosphoadenylyl-sulfate reductase [Verrucomicrobiae bacterium]|nr:phosphoadenylyl-sulfate reductase [Verrucomicrobiae bacterium]
MSLVPPVKQKESRSVTQVDPASQLLENASASDRVRWTVDNFGSGLIMSTSFGAQSAVMLHLVSSIAPQVPIIWVDTGYLFPETYKFAETLRERLNLNLHVYQAQMTPARQEALYGKLWEQGKAGLEKYNLINKVEPMNRALVDFGARGWLAGLRREQASSRKHLDVVMKQGAITKIHPIIDWTDREIYQYLTNNNLPYHPLWEEGYVSIGDVHSTSRLMEGMSAEETRFGGVKRECGLHELSGQSDFMI